MANNNYPIGMTVEFPDGRYSTNDPINGDKITLPTYAKGRISEDQSEVAHSSRRIDVVVETTLTDQVISESGNGLHQVVLPRLLLKSVALTVQK